MPGCGTGGCKKMVREKIGTDVEIIFSYDYLGIGPDAAAKAIREASINRRALDFNQFK